MDKETKRIREEIDKTAEIAKYRDPFCFGVGYGAALTDIGDFLFKLKQAKQEVNNKMIAFLLKDLNTKKGEEIGKLLK